MDHLNSLIGHPVFIVSTGRSGSTMIARALALHPSLCVFHEPHPHLRTEAFVKWSKPDPDRQKLIEKKIKKKREDFINQIMINRLVYVESSNYASHLIDELYRIFDAKFVHLYRDGRDFVRSGLERNWYLPLPLRSRIKTWIRRRYLIDIGKSAVDYQLLPPIELKTRFEKIAWLWSEINKVILNSFSSIPMDRKFSLRLENFNIESLTELHNFIGINIHQELLNKMLEIANSKPNKSKKNTIPHHSNWSDYEKQRFNAIAGDMMRTLGYYS